MPKNINGNENLEFDGDSIENLSVLAGGYIITPLGEIILVKDTDEHRIIFSKYINYYLDNGSNTLYNTLISTKMLCDLGCCIYAGVRLEYSKNMLEQLSDCMGSLTFPKDLDSLTSIQKEICLKLIESNKSIVSGSEKIFVQYGSFPDNIYTKEEIVNILKKKEVVRKLN